MPDLQTLTLTAAKVIRDSQTLLGPIDLTLESQGITAILGHNGAGKSLFLKLAHGQFAADGGRVEWNGRDAQSTRRERSFMFQNAPLLRRSVIANIEYPLAIHGVSKSDSTFRVAEALEKARLTHRALAPAASLSGGERQRMALARAWVTRPHVILLDEPSASLDPASTKELESMVFEIAASGVKVLIATHDLSQAKRLAADVLMFGEGKLLAQGPADHFFAETQSAVITDFLEGRL